MGKPSATYGRHTQVKRTIVGVSVGGFLLALLLHRVDIRQVGVALWDVRTDLLAMGLAIQLAVMWIKAMRWGIAIRGATGRPVYRVFSASMIGFTGNVLLPARLGELARVSVIDKHNHVGRPLALTTLGITLLFDVLVLVGSFLMISIWVSNLFTAHRWTVSLLGVVALLILGSLVILQYKSQALRSLLRPIRWKLPHTLERRVTRYVELFRKGLSILRNGYMIGKLLLLTIAAWSLEIVAEYLILRAFHIEASLLIAAMLVVVVNLSFAFPITPGNVGVFQALSVVVLGAFGVTEVSALAYGIGAQGATFVLIVALGMICFYREGMNLHLLGRAADGGASERPTPAMEIP